MWGNPHYDDLQERKRPTPALAMHCMPLFFCRNILDGSAVPLNEEIMKNFILEIFDS